MLFTLNDQVEPNYKWVALYFTQKQIRELKALILLNQTPLHSDLILSVKKN